MKRWILIISLSLNVIFIVGFSLNWFNSPTYKLGRLVHNLKVGYSGGDSVFILPKGLIVRDISQQGLSAIGQFENSRFEIVITSENDKLVNYNSLNDSLMSYGNFYSVDLNGKIAK